MASKIRSGDKVIVNTGKDKGKRGQVLQVLENGKVLVEGVNLVKKHVKPNPMKGTAGGVVEKLLPIDVSNVSILNSATDKADRVKFVVVDGKKQRAFASTGELLQVKN